MHTARLLGAILCPAWLSSALVAHQRRRALVLEIWALSDRPTAFAALWLARWYAIGGGTVEGALRLFRANLCR